MCGIVGCVDRADVAQVVLDGLRRLEYRGYDSAGIAAVSASGVSTARAPGKLSFLEEHLRDVALPGCAAIGHTRWATHGRPTRDNAHPHTDEAGEVAIVHNGIIENYAELRAELVGRGRRLASETDSEVIAHLIAEGLAEGLDFVAALRACLARLEGTYAIVALRRGETDRILAVRQGSPLVVAYGEGRMLVASDVPAVLPYSRRVIYLEDSEVAVLTADSVEILGATGESLLREATTIEWNLEAAEKGGYDHFMLKEISEQPGVLHNTLRGRLCGDRLRLDGVPLTAVQAKALRRIDLVACGTSWHAALVARYLIEELTGLSVQVDIASEYRYRRLRVGPDVLSVFVSQSGETADTLASMREVARQGGTTLAVCNVVGSSLAREASGVLYTLAGPEISVASTKAFSTQVATLYMLALHLAEARGEITSSALSAQVSALGELPMALARVIEQCAPMAEWAQEIAAARDVYFIGRGAQYPIALEGALKLKEISYLHAEGYAAGELKHGPIALLDSGVPVVALAPGDALAPKTLSNIQEVAARGACVYAIGTAGTAIPSAERVLLLDVPAEPSLWPILLNIPMQLLAYYTALALGREIDQPKNLAKSVTVE